MYLPSGFLLKTIINSKTSLNFARPPVITLVKSFSVSNQVFTEQKFAVVSLYHLETIDQVDSFGCLPVDKLPNKLQEALPKPSWSVLEAPLPREEQCRNS